MALNKKRQLTYRLASISRVVSVGTKRSEVHKYALLFPLFESAVYYSSLLTHLACRTGLVALVVLFLVVDNETWSNVRLVPFDKRIEKRSLFSSDGWWWNWWKSACCRNTDLRERSYLIFLGIENGMTGRGGGDIERAAAMPMLHRLHYSYKYSRVHV